MSDSLVRRGDRDDENLLVTSWPADYQGMHVVAVQ